MKYLSKKTKAITAGNNLTAEELIEIINETGNSMSSELFNNRLSELGYTFVNNDTRAALTTVPASNTTTSSFSVASLSSNSVFIAYSNTASTNQIYGVVVTISGQVITAGVGTAATTVPASNTLAGQISVTVLSSTSVFIGYGNAASTNQIFGVVCNISGQTITPGVGTAATTVPASHTTTATLWVSTLSSTSVFIAYSNTASTNQIFGVVCNISGQTITAGVGTAATTVPASNTATTPLQVVTLSSTSVFVGYFNTAATSNLYGTVCNISGQTITAGVGTSLGGANSYISLVALSSTTVFAAFNNAILGGLGGALYSISGQTPSIISSTNNQLTTTLAATSTNVAA
jgi:hypothetical protein